MMIDTWLLFQTRKQAIAVSCKLYEERDLHDLIEQFAVAQLSFLKQEESPKELQEGEDSKWDCEK